MTSPPRPAVLRRTRALAAATALVLGCALAACGSDGGGAAGPPGQSRTADKPDSTPKGEPGNGAGEHGEKVRSQADRAEQEARKQKRPERSKLRHPVFGADVSWPQCRKGVGIPERPGLGLPMPLASAQYVVLGLTNGPAFTANPCLANQLDWAQDRHLLVSAYAVVSWPAADRYGGADHEGPYDGTTRLGKLRNSGYAQAEFNVRTLQRLDFRTPAVWVDVEPYPTFPWSQDRRANAAVVQGVVRAYRDAGFRVGFYSTRSLWEQVVGDLRFGQPEWRAAGNTSVTEALSRCAADSSFQGGEALMAQWTDGRRDYNVTCPGQAKRLPDWFHQY